MWVQLTSTQNVEIAGKLTTFRAGDWIDVGKQKAREWVAAGSARTVEPESLDLFIEGTGVYVRGDPTKILTYLGPYAKRGLVTDEFPVLHFPKTCILKPVGNVPRLDVFPAAWALLDRWEVVAPLLSYDDLAVDRGTPGERHRTLQFVRDLRVPVYDPRVIFVRRCEAGERLVSTFLEERKHGGDEPLAFLRAVHIVKPLILAAPRTWYDRNAHRVEKW